MSEYLNVSVLLGRTLASVENQLNQRIVFVTDDGECYEMWHEQDCCESVTVEDIVGDLNDLVGSPLTMAEESTSDERPTDLPKPDYEDESQTWTFYRFATVKGYVNIRWYGSSNGYYSESVTFAKTGDAPASRP